MKSWSTLSENHRIVAPGRALWSSLVYTPLKAGWNRAGCSGPCSIIFWVLQAETPQPLWSKMSNSLFFPHYFQIILKTFLNVSCPILLSWLYLWKSDHHNSRLKVRDTKTISLPSTVQFCNFKDKFTITFHT